MNNNMQFMEPEPSDFLWEKKNIRSLSALQLKKMI